MKIINRSLAALLIFVVYHNVVAQHRHTDLGLSSFMNASASPLPVHFGSGHCSHLFAHSKDLAG